MYPMLRMGEKRCQVTSIEKSNNGELSETSVYNSNQTQLIDKPQYMNRDICVKVCSLIEESTRRPYHS